MRTGFLELGRGEIDSDFFGRETKFGASDGGTDALAGLGNGFAGHANDIETRETISGGTLDFDEATVIAIGNGGIYFCNHDASI